MNKIFIEAKKKETTEYHFIKTILDVFFPKKKVDFIFMDGIGNLYNETILNQMRLAQDNGEQIILLTDADTKEKGVGFAKRKAEIDNGMNAHSLSFPYFIYPNNQDDGDIENLMESTARRNLHPTFFDCFEDYEKCVSGAKDANGNPLYNTPNLKGKLHTYISSQQLSKNQRDKLGSGNWLFKNENYWNLNAETLEPLKNFLKQNLK